MRKFTQVVGVYNDGERDDVSIPLGPVAGTDARACAELGFSFRAYCAMKGFAENTYFYWKRRLREAVRTQIEAEEADRPLPRVLTHGDRFADYIPDDPDLVIGAVKLLAVLAAQVDELGADRFVDTSLQRGDSYRVLFWDQRHNFFLAFKICLGSHSYISRNQPGQVNWEFAQIGNVQKPVRLLQNATAPAQDVI